MICRECDGDVPASKRWGYRNMCDECDSPERVRKSMAVTVADGKTDYYFKIVHNPTPQEAEAIRAAGIAHDPRTQLRAINKVSS